MTETEEPLAGGNVATVCRVGRTVRRRANPWTANINSLLRHVRGRGLACVPEPLGFDTQGRQSLSFVDGHVPHDLPPWLWANSVLQDSARMLRRWHDATEDFRPPNPDWGLEPRVPDEVVCHNDFAPYNCVFRDQQLIALIDFDACAPGPRIWDVAYALYRFVPLLPPRGDPAACAEASPFSWNVALDRIALFLHAYDEGGTAFHFSTLSCLLTAADKLLALADWTERHSLHSENPALHQHALMYRAHAVWLEQRASDLSPAT